MLGEQILTETLEDLDFFEKIKTKLFGSPDRAADKLVAALEKVSKIYLLINSMLTMYLSLEFDQLSEEDEQKVLLSLKRDNLRSQVEQARPHSSKIARIYTLYLTHWFAVLRQDEQERMRKLFGIYGCRTTR